MCCLSVTSSPVGAYDLGATDPQTTVILNATNPEVFYPDPDPLLHDKFNADERPVVLSAGRMVPKKGFDTALRALKLVREKIPDVLLLLAGSGPESSSLRQLTRDLDLESNVRFLGDLSQDQLRRYYTLADVFMMVGREIPDDVEGFGLVYLEANACGTPVIGARVGGVLDAIEDGQTGLLVPPENPDAAAAATIKLLTHPDLATTLGEHGRRRVRSSLHWDAVADRIHDTLTAP